MSIAWTHITWTDGKAWAPARGRLALVLGVLLAVPLLAQDSGDRPASLERVKRELQKDGPAGGDTPESDEDARESSRRRDRSVEFLSYADAVARARKEYRPLLFYFDGGAGYTRKEGDLPELWESAVDDSSFRKAVGALLLCRLASEDLDDDYPLQKAAEDAPVEKEPVEGDERKPATTVGGRLGVVDGVPALVFVDFRERPLKRLTDELPTRSQLATLVRAFTRKNAQLAVYARKAEKVLEQSRYAWQLGKRKIAIEKIVPFEWPKEREKMDPVFRERVDAVIKLYREEAAKAMRHAASLDAKKDYANAIKAYTDVVREFPFKDIVEDANRRRGEILRKAQIGI